MRVVLSTWGSRGDVEPLAALAVRLREQGAEALVCAPPDEEFAVLLDRVGVPLEPMGPSVRSVVTGTRPPSESAAMDLAPELVASRFDVLGRVAPGADAILATGLMPAGARSVAEKLGIAYLSARFHPFGLPSHHFLPPMWRGAEADFDRAWAEDADWVNSLYRESLNRHRAELGLAPVDNVRDHVHTERMLLAADPVLAPWAELTDLELVQTGAWLLADDRPLPADLESFLDAGTPPVYVGFGSMAMRGAPDLARTVVSAIRAQGRRVLLSRGWAELADADCFAVGEVNHQALFRRVAAVIHHGGAGTTTTAAQAGAPQVIVPQLVDQPHWAARVAELGIGAAHEGPTPTVESLSAALAKALAPDTATRAREVAGTIRTDGAEVAAKLVIEAAS